MLYGLLGLTLLVCIAGTYTLPMDGHEVYVVQTAQEMHDRNDWIIPWFNHEPRLNKPPLNYWLTAAIAWLNGSPEDIQAWHGRLVSILAALGLVILTGLIADSLFNREIAWLAMLMLISSKGFFTYSHDARPDMLYAFLCTLGYGAIILAWKTPDHARRTLFSLIAWAGYGLATLAKGPQLPLMYLLASVIFCRIQAISWKETAGLLRPLTGILIFLLITAPWWLLLHLKLGGTGLLDTQLSGKLFSIDIKKVINLYYFYRPLIFILPWVIFAPFAAWQILDKNTRTSQHILLLLFIAVPALLLSFGSQQRWYYLLPSLIPMVILLADGAYRFVQRARDYLPSPVPGFLIQLHLLLSIAFFSYLIIYYRRENTTTLNIFIITLVLLIIAQLLLMVKKLSLFQQLLTVCVMINISFITMGLTHTGWSKDRFERHEIALRAHALVEPGTEVICWDVTPDIYVYYTKSPIPRASSFQEIQNYINLTGNKKVVVITEKKNIELIPVKIGYEIIDILPDDKTPVTSLVLISLYD